MPEGPQRKNHVSRRLPPRGYKRTAGSQQPPERVGREIHKVNQFEFPCDASISIDAEFNVADSLVDALHESFGFVPFYETGLVERLIKDSSVGAGQIEERACRCDKAIVRARIDSLVAERASWIDDRHNLRAANGRFLRHRPKRSERCLNYGNCTKASDRCQRAKVCRRRRRPSVKTMLDDR